MEALLVYYFLARNQNFFSESIKKLNKNGDTTVLFTSREQLIQKIIKDHPKINSIVFEKSLEQKILIENLRKEMGYKCFQSEHGELPPDFFQNSDKPNKTEFSTAWRIQFKHKYKIPPQMFLLLEIFLDNIEQNQSVEGLCRQLWNSTEKNYRQTLYQYIHDLRLILKKDEQCRLTIEKTAGNNYCLYQI